jgi:Uma2 family endonuclease
MTAPTRANSKPETGNSQVKRRKRDLPIISIDLPVMCEDEGQEDMGESTPHTETDHILSICLRAHFRAQPKMSVFSNLNVHYHPVKRRAYVSPDVMVVHTEKASPDRMSSYRIGPNRPAPILVIEILRKRSAEQHDLTKKPVLYSNMGVAEYILIDCTGEQLPDRPLLKRLQNDGSWKEENDSDGGVTSQLGFRIVIEDDDLPRMVEAANDKRYARPDEAQRTADETAMVEERIRSLEEELTRFRAGSTMDKNGKGRRHKS